MSDILDKGLKHYKIAKDGWSEINTKAKADQLFLSDEPWAQWDEQQANERVRVGRPTVEIDQLTQYVHQVTNDIRMNTPTIHVIPDGNGADIETAEMIQGRIKAIEYKSNADAAYDLAADFSVKSSLGYIRVDHGYKNDDGFEQELKILRVVNPQSILIDPSSIEADGSDAKYGFALEEITVADFKEKYPDADPVSFGDDKPSRAPQDQDSITIAEYFYIENGEEEIGLLPDGRTEPVNKKSKYKSKRKIKKPTVMRCWLSGQDVLEEPRKFPGKYVPLVPVYGEESWVAGKRHLFSLIRKAKSPARMYNQLKSSEIEILMKQQQSPVQAAVGQMRGFEDDWKQPDKAMVLYYHTTDANGTQVPPPQRLQPPTVSAGYAAASMDAENNIKKSLGMYSAAVGKREGDSSGKALQQLEQSSDLATLHFADNLIRSITQVGKIIVCALPEIEDTPRIVPTVGKEDEIKYVGINGERVEGQDRDYYYNKGSWDVRVVAGASFTTQRQQAAAYYADIVGKMPDLMPVIGDLVFKYQDTPGAQAISSRLKKLVDPKLLDESERDKNKEDPRIAQLTQEATQVMQVAQQEIQQLQAELQKTQQELQSSKSDIAAKTVDAEVKQAEIPLKARELQIKEDANKIKLIEIQEKTKTERMAIEADLTKTRIAAKQQVATPDVVMTDGDFHDGEAPIAVMLGQITQAMTKQSQELNQGLQLIAQATAASAQTAQAGTTALVNALNKPKKVAFDAQGNPIGIQ